MVECVVALGSANASRHRTLYSNRYNISPALGTTSHPGRCHSAGLIVAGSRYPRLMRSHRSRGIPVGMDLQVTVFVDGEVTLPPAGHVVEFARFRNRPGARSGRGGAGPQASACKCAHRRDHRINVSAPNASDKFRSYVVETGIGVPSASMATRTTSASVTFTRSPRWPALQRSTSTSTLTVTDVRPTRRVSV